MVYTGHDTLMPIIRNMRSLTADGPTEELTFACGSLEWTYTDYDASGKPEGEIHAMAHPYGQVIGRGGPVRERSCSLRNRSRDCRISPVEY